MRTKTFHGTAALLFQFTMAVSGCENTTTIELLPGAPDMVAPPDMTRLPEVLLGVPSDANGQVTMLGGAIAIGDQLWIPYTDGVANVHTDCLWTFTKCQLDHDSKGFFLKLSKGAPKINCRIGVLFRNLDEAHLLNMDATYLMNGPTSPSCGGTHSCLRATIELSQGFSSTDPVLMKQEQQAGLGDRTVKPVSTMVSGVSVPAGVPLVLSLSVSIDMQNGPAEADSDSVCFQAVKLTSVK